MASLGVRKHVSRDRADREERVNLVPLARPDILPLLKRDGPRRWRRQLMRGCFSVQRTRIGVQEGRRLRELQNVIAQAPAQTGALL